MQKLRITNQQQKRMITYDRSEQIGISEHCKGTKKWLQTALFKDVLHTVQKMVSFDGRISAARNVMVI